MGTKKHKSDRERTSGVEKSRERERERAADHEHRTKRRRRSRSSSRSRSPPPPSSSSEHRRAERKEKAPVEPAAPAASGGGDSSLSVEETNRLRVQLGLKPLETAAEDTEGAVAGQPQPDVHVPAKNIGAEQAAEAVRARIETAKAHRRVASKLARVRTLGESDGEAEGEAAGVGASSWVQRSRRIEEDKKQALHRAKMLAEMDEDFGVTDTIRSEAERERNQSYTARHLRGLNVEHAPDRFQEGRDLVLVVKDRGVLAADADEVDTLVNPNLVEEEAAEKNTLLRKRGTEYRAYEDDEWDAAGNYQPRETLAKYSEVIDGEKKSSFRLAAGGKLDASREAAAKATAALRRPELHRADYPELRVASEFFTEQEMEQRFKKRKRKVRVVRKRLRADDLLADGPEPSDADGAKPMVQLPQATSEPEEEDLVGPAEDLTGLLVEPDDASEELQRALSKAIKAKTGLRGNPQAAAAELLRSHGTDAQQAHAEAPGAGGLSITLNRTAEFCRSLGDIPTYGQSGNRDEQEPDELAEFEAELQEERRRREEASEAAGGWQAVGGAGAGTSGDGDGDTAGTGASGILDDEPVLNKGGVAAALAMASRKGYLEQERGPDTGVQIVSALRAKNVVQEDLRYDDIDAKFNKQRGGGGGGDRYAGPLSDFREKSGYRPEVRLEYVDHCGRDINAKEAFRDLSHRFHGKYSGKKKTEKREKRIKEGILMRAMSSSDTPLGTADKLHRKLERQGQAYVVLSGKGRDGGAVS